MPLRPTCFILKANLATPRLIRSCGSNWTGFGNEALQRNLIFYLATSPSQFAPVAEQLHSSGLLLKSESLEFEQKLVVEKPFGHDLPSARQLNQELTRFAHEKQIYRIDHYLGKETVQNILMFRFSNAVFEQLWTRQSR